MTNLVQFSSVTSDSLRPHELQHTRPPVHHQLPELTQTLGIDDGQGGLACCNSWDRKESDTTERLN